jgi:hypothetical protein
MARRIILMDAVPLTTVDTSGFALKSEIPSMPDTSGFALKSEIPSMLDTSGFALKSEIPSLPDLSPYAKKTEVTASINSAKGEIVVDEGTRNQFIKDIMDNADNQIGGRLNKIDEILNDLEPRVKDCEDDLETQKEINNSLKGAGYLADAGYPRTITLNKGGVFKDPNIRKQSVVITVAEKTADMPVGSVLKDHQGFYISNDADVEGLVIENLAGDFTEISISLE